MKSYKKTITVKETDLDDLDHVNNIRYIEWIQDISKEHWQKTVPTEELELYIWVVRHHDITYHASALLQDTLELTTHIKSWRGPLSIRQVEIKNKVTGKTLITAETEWCLLQPENARPKRVPEHIANMFV
ncbi:thioesterase family protein [Flavobacterium sp. ASW18X]|uniref:acyl-CoA thioesterase n=1 Tax=Flavobacterium sp. ASW18X TaxID=2572595 RepID=UPI0010ADA6C5|nr:acyl-CoA thioesterase [Flavobacterium sp. ASW18X]TKD65876.1 acyl-CoA thioesterase [Flavobacterium sp. ASW18X]